MWQCCCRTCAVSHLTGVDILCDGGIKAGANLKPLIALARGTLADRT